MGKYDLKRILITGSEGNIGSRLVPYLKLQGHVVFRTDIIQATEDDYKVVNILCHADLDAAFELFKPEVVYHMAAMVSRVTCEDSPSTTIETNITGLHNVMVLCKKYRAKLIYFSTSEVYGNIGGVLSEDRDCEPNNLYGLTKYLGEKLVEYEVKNGLDAVIVRPFMFYDEFETKGEHRSAMIRFTWNLLRKEKVTVHKGSSRPWMHMSDAVKILERIMYEPFGIYNIGTDELIKSKDLALMICTAIGVDYNEYVIEENLPEKMTLNKIPDIRKTKSFGIVPEITINEGICIVLKTLRQYL
jgi:nucleoside-diphosphate-sugar epimerase